MLPGLDIQADVPVLSSAPAVHTAKAGLGWTREHPLFPGANKDIRVGSGGSPWLSIWLVLLHLLFQLYSVKGKLRSTQCPRLSQMENPPPQRPSLYVFQILFWLPKVIQSDPKLVPYNLN